MVAEPTRMRVLAAVALGATTTAEILAASGVPAKEAVSALRRLQDHGVVASGPEGLQVAYERLGRLAEEIEPERPADGEPGLSPFIRDGKLTSVPAQWGRREIILQHIVEQSFEPGVEYDEPAVNERLRAWCEGGEVDHVAIRRYVIDMGIMSRAEGRYRMEMR
jgi:hypothetical protein